MRLPKTKFYKPSALTFEFQFWTPRSKKGGVGQVLVKWSTHSGCPELARDAGPNFYVFIKGSCQKLLSRFFSVKGGGYPPFPLRVFGQDDFPLRGEGGNPQFR